MSYIYNIFMLSAATYIVNYPLLRSIKLHWAIRPNIPNKLLNKLNTAKPILGASYNVNTCAILREDALCMIKPLPKVHRDNIGKQLYRRDCKQLTKIKKNEKV